MCKVFSIIVIALGVVLGIIAALVPAESLSGLAFIPKFFEIFIPILGAGALIKYLFSYKCGCSCCNKGTECSK